MKLSVFKREKNKKSVLTNIRARKNIPAIIYGNALENTPVFVQGDEFSAALREIPKNHLSNTVFSLSYEGKSYQAIVKGIEYHKVTYQPLHLDLMVVEQQDRVKVNIPIVCVGMVDCAALKQGGILRQVIRSFRVECSLQDMPRSFVVDVQSMNIGDAKRLADITLPESIKPLLHLNEVAITIAKR